MCRAPMMTQSVGVPLTAKWRSPIARSRSGSLRDSECDTPDWSYSGAITQMSSDSARPICSQTPSPSAWMPSSLVIRMRTGKRSSGMLDGLAAAHIGRQRIGHRDRAVLLLIVLQDGDQGAADRDTRAVQGMQVAHMASLVAVPSGHATRLELTAIRARRNFPICLLPRQPDLDVVGLLRRKPHVAGTQRHHPVMQVEPAQHLLGAGEHALMLVRALLRRGDRDQLDLAELMLADHAAGIPAGGAGLGPEAW